MVPQVTTDPGLGASCLAWPLGPPGSENPELFLGVAFLAGAEGIALVEVQAVLLITVQYQQVLVEEHQIRPLVKSREHREGLFQFQGQTARLGVAALGACADLDQTQNLTKQGVADARDGTAGTAVHIAVEDLRVHSDHQGHV